jgi:lysophospholipase L1-like esterase
MADCVQFADRIVVPYRPQAVVLYAGDNDIASGKPAEAVLADFKAFAAAVLDRLLETHIVFVSIKPSPQRWHLAGEMRQANDLIRAHIATDARLAYVDVATPMLGADGTPRPELYAEDRLHMSPEGYRLWASTLRPVLEAARRG